MYSSLAGGCIFAKYKNVRALLDIFQSFLKQPARKLLRLGQKREKNKLANVLIISDSDSMKNINKSARNIKNVKLIKDEGTNIYDLFKYKNVIMTTTSIKKLQERILNEKN